MARQYGKFEMPVSLAERNEQLAQARKKLASTRQYDEPWTGCGCCGGEYVACPHPKQERRNYDWDTINDKIKELQAMIFCENCTSQRLSKSWIRCPYCPGEKDTWIGGEHDRPECRASPAGLKYCGGCGKLN